MSLESSSRRGFLALGVGATASLAGCTGVLGDDGAVAAHENRLRVELAGDGSSYPVELTVTANEIEIEEEIERDAELELDRGGLEEGVDVEVEDEDDLEVDVEWRVGDVRVTFEIDQDAWERTAVEAGFTVEDGRISFDADADVSLPDAGTTATASDERPADAWEYAVDVRVEDHGAETDVEFAVDRDD